MHYVLSRVGYKSRKKTNNNQTEHEKEITKSLKGNYELYFIFLF